MLRGILNPGMKWQQGHNESKDLIEILMAWERDISRYRIASSEDISENVLVATVLEHAPLMYCDSLRMMPQASRSSYAGLRGYIREWCVAQRTYDARGNQATSASSCGPTPMDIGQIKGGRQEQAVR